MPTERLPGTIRAITIKSTAENSSRAAATESASILAMARAATMPSSASPAAATSPRATPARVCVPSADEPASAAVRAAPRPAAMTPSHAIRLSLWRSSRCARRAPNAGYVAVAVSASEGPASLSAATYPPMKTGPPSRAHAATVRAVRDATSRTIRENVPVMPERARRNSAAAESNIVTVTSSVASGGYPDIREDCRASSTATRPHVTPETRPSA